MNSFLWDFIQTCYEGKVLCVADKTIVVPRGLFPVCLEGGTLFTSWSGIEKRWRPLSLSSLCLINLRCGFSFSEGSRCKNKTKQKNKKQNPLSQTKCQCVCDWLFLHNGSGFLSHVILSRRGLLEVLKLTCCVYMILILWWDRFIVDSLSISF